jgi:hypothetical protein
LTQITFLSCHEKLSSKISIHPGFVMPTEYRSGLWLGRRGGAEVYRDGSGVTGLNADRKCLRSRAEDQTPHEYPGAECSGEQQDTKDGHHGELARGKHNSRRRCRGWTNGHRVEAFRVHLGVGMSAPGTRWGSLSTGNGRRRAVLATPVCKNLVKIASLEQGRGVGSRGVGVGSVRVGNHHLTGAGRAADHRSRLAMGDAHQLVTVSTTKADRHGSTSRHPDPVCPADPRAEGPGTAAPV